MTTDFAGASEALLEGTEEAAGVVVAGGDMGRLLAGCRRVAEDEELRARYAVAARIRAERVFSPHAVLHRLDAAYEQAVTRRRTRRT